ncbi:MAG: hypothetical protein MUF42_17175 [Cytophagaceae bacterium]|jgi:hypothetical protein|nr:hypothetical protein [Cytophagaceae bacterium]
MKQIFLIVNTFFLVTFIYGQQVDTKVFNAFKQGNVKEGGNCVSIAIIKAAFSKFGYENIFKSIQEVDATKYKVTMRDNSEVSFTKNELNIISERANFRLKDSTEFSIKFKKFAEFCFAAMCKKVMILNNYQTLDSAITDLNNGYTTEISNVLLGLKFKKIKPKRATKINHLEHLVIFNSYHAVYASNGYYDECWNETGIEKIKNLKWKRFGIKCAWKMCSISGALMIID